MDEYDREDALDITPVTKPSIDEVVALLQLSDEENEHVPAVAYYGLSDLDEASLQVLEPVWQKLPADYRRKIVNELGEASEANFDLNFDALGYVALDDANASVRSAAIDLLWTDESLNLLSRLINFAEKLPAMRKTHWANFIAFLSFPAFFR